jgi:hypothetical protein
LSGALSPRDLAGVSPGDQATADGAADDVEVPLLVLGPVESQVPGKPVRQWQQASSRRVAADAVRLLPGRVTVSQSRRLMVAADLLLMRNQAISNLSIIASVG